MCLHVTYVTLIDNELQRHTVRRSEVRRSPTTYFNVAICHNHKGNDTLKRWLVNITTKKL